MLSIDLQGLGMVSHKRMVEDLRATSALIASARAAGRSVSWPHAFLRRIGSDMLHAVESDHGAVALRYDPAETADLASCIYDYAFDGTVPIPVLVAAVILGREDLYPTFCVAGAFVLERGLQWFVLHGVQEHRLWHLMTTGFISSVRLRTLAWRGGWISPLHALLVIERPDLVTIFGDDPLLFEENLSTWLLQGGADQYRLHWALTDVEYRRLDGRQSNVGRAATTVLPPPTDLSRDGAFIDYALTRQPLFHNRPFLYNFRDAELAGLALKGSGQAQAVIGGIGLRGLSFDFSLAVLRLTVRYLLVELIHVEEEVRSATLTVNGEPADAGDVDASGALMLRATLSETTRQSPVHKLTVQRRRPPKSASSLGVWGTLARCWAV